jgi:hypothetical protein
MTPSLVTLEQAKDQCEVIGTDQDVKITQLVRAASAAVLNYLGDGADFFLDSSGWVDPEPDSSGISIVPAEVQQATLLLVEEFFAHRGSDGGQGAQWAQGFLPPVVTALLYPLRDPALG